MKVYATNSAFNLVEANIIKPLKTCTGNRADPVIWNQEMFLPSHEYVLFLCQGRNVKMAFPCLLLVGTEGRELGPML